MIITYAKLKDETWGIRSDRALDIDATVTVTKRSGETKSEIVREFCYSSNDQFFYTIAQRTRSVRAEAQVEDEGVYVIADAIIKMKRSKADRLYAMKLVEISGTRTTDASEHVHFDWQYAPELTASVRAEHKMSIEQAKFFGIRYGRCLRCGRRLKDAESVEAAIGPICRQFFERAA